MLIRKELSHITASNKNLTEAKKAKNDEFYTQREDIEAELSHYEKYFRNKIVYCNCNDSKESEFWKFFIRVFQQWGLKKLIAVHYEPNKDNFSYKLEAIPVKNGQILIIKSFLLSNGDFRSEACIELLKKVDIVVTNPPFSLFREYVAQLMKYGKKFVIMGNINATKYKEVFPLIRDNLVRLGLSITSGDRKFNVPDDYPLKAAGCGIDENGRKYIRVKGVRWFTNLDIKKCHVPIDLSGNYYKGHEDKYPKYDNYDAINVDKVADIPIDYKGVMGVPITFLDKYCPQQFKIVAYGRDLFFTIMGEKIYPYARIFIQHRF